MSARLHLFFERSVWPEQNTFAWFAINAMMGTRERCIREYLNWIPRSLINLKTFTTCQVTCPPLTYKLAKTWELQRTPVEPAGMTTRCQIISSVLVGKPAEVNRCVGSVAPNLQISQKVAWEIHQLHWCSGVLVDIELSPAPALLTTGELH